LASTKEKWIAYYKAMLPPDRQDPKIIEALAERAIKLGYPVPKTTPSPTATPTPTPTATPTASPTASAKTTPKPTPKKTSVSSPTQDPYAGFKGSSPQATGDPVAKDIYNSTDAYRKELAILLKNAGFNVPTTGKQSTSIAIADAYIQARQQAILENSRLGITRTVEQWLKDNVKTPTGTKVGGPSTQIATNVLSPTEATAEINKVFQDLLGRDATSEELTAFKKQLEAAEKANPTKTTYKTVNGVTTSSTTGGIDRDQFLTNLINQDKNLKAELGKIETTDANVLRREKDKAIFDKAVAAAAGDANKIATIQSTTSYGKALENVRRQVETLATTAGAVLTAEELDAIAKEATDQALDTNIYQLKAFIDSKLKFGAGKDGVYKGAAGESVDALTKIAAANGLDLQKAFGAQLPDWLTAINKGESIETYKKIIRDVAKIGMPEKVAKLIDQGIDLSTIYAPYKNIMATTLEINPQTIDINDPTLRSAITADTEVPIYEFERQLRKDNRWQYTNQAKQEVASATQKILQDFGFMG